MRLPRIITALLLSIATMTAAIGMLPPAQWLVGLFGGEAEAFPCADHACGCASAHACWTGCCCFSREDKIRWAIANDVTPPPAAGVRLAELEAAEPTSCCSSLDEDDGELGAPAPCGDDATWLTFHVFVGLPGTGNVELNDLLLPHGTTEPIRARVIRGRTVGLDPPPPRRAG